MIYVKAPRKATLALGRDGMGDYATPEDFDAWVSYVDGRIDAKTGLIVTVHKKGRRDTQDDTIRVEGTEDSDPAADREMVLKALADLWASWCEEIAE